MMMHLYVGNGKGKTTASFGLVARHAGYGKKVLVAQFLKNYESGEIKYFKKDLAITILDQFKVEGFYPFLTTEQQQIVKALMQEQFALIQASYTSYTLIILDEIIDAINLGIIEEQALIDFINVVPEGIDVVCTGRNPSPLLIELADYFTEFVQLKHPYQKGIKARASIEY